MDAIASELEAALDETYTAFPLPHPNRVLSTWYCLTAAEDSLRLLFTDRGSQLPESRIIFYIDRFKFSLRYALDRIRRETRDQEWMPVPRRVLSRLYLRATKLMSAGIAEFPQLGTTQFPRLRTA